MTRKVVVGIAQAVSLVLMWVGWALGEGSLSTSAPLFTIAWAVAWFGCGVITQPNVHVTVVDRNTRRHG